MSFRFTSAYYGEYRAENIKRKMNRIMASNEIHQKLENILIVDDHEINQIVLLSILRKLDYKAEVANSGQKALEALKNKAYDLIFIDLQMPGMNGYSTTQYIFSQYDIDARPWIVAVSADPSPREKRECLALGMIDYIEKPLNSLVIENILKKSLKRLG